jgi:hypothetical protein
VAPAMWEDDGGRMGSWRKKVRWKVGRPRFPRLVVGSFPAVGSRMIVWRYSAQSRRISHQIGSADNLNRNANTAPITSLCPKI